MLMNVAAYPKQFEKNINKMYMDAAANYVTEYDKIFKVEQAPAGRYYREAELSGLGQLRAIKEGGRVDFDAPVEGHDKQVAFDTIYGLGAQITQIAMEDDYHGKIAQVPKTLAESALNKIETVAFGVFNNGFSTETAWDGKPLFSNAHTMLNGEVVSNLGSSDLSETSLQAAFEYFWKLKNESGRPIRVQPDILLVPIELTWMAARLAQQLGGITTETADLPNMIGNIMTTNPKYGIVPGWKAHVSRFLTDADTWFLGSLKDSSLRVMFKSKPKLESADDFATGSALFKVTTRFRAFAMGYKAWYGAA